MDFDKIVVVTQKTWLEGLVEKFGTKSQAQFYLQQNRLPFEPYQYQNDQYYASLRQLKKLIPPELRVQFVEREFLPNFLFSPKDLVVTVGRDGLVVNTAKYLEEQRILALNPDPAKIEGVLLPFTVTDFPRILEQVRKDEEAVTHVTMAKATLHDQQTLYGVNDIFIGHQSHQSARYTIRFRGVEERHSSSGIIVSTGAGSTGWFKSIVTGAVAIANMVKHTNLPIPEEQEFRFPWDANHLFFSVREPWISKTSGGSLIFSQIYAGEALEIESSMPEGGVIFSDGIESDFLRFTSGTVARVMVAEKKAHLIVQ